jgi:c-di-GMP-binding flagellar brake protein YcgR
MIQDRLDIKEGFIHNLPIVVKIKNREQEYYAVVLNPTDDYVLISPIITSEGYQLTVKEGETIEIATKFRGVLWSGFCSIVEVLKHDFEGIWLTYPPNLQKVQRRGFLRLEMTFPLSVNIYQDGVPFDSINGFCHDLSGSGVCMNLQRPLQLKENQTAHIAFSYKGLDVNNQIKSVYSFKQGQFYRIGCQFINMEQGFSDKLHKFIVQEQIAIKKGGMY